jgi:hypothetical protein
MDDGLAEPATGIDAGDAHGARSLWVPYGDTMRDPAGPRDLLRAGVLDAELLALLSVLLEARFPVVAVGRSAVGTGRVIDGLAGLLALDARQRAVLPDDDFHWLAEATELGWRRDRAGSAATGDRLSSTDGVLIARGLAQVGGITGERARIVVRALVLGFGLLATMDGDGLDDVLNALHDPSVGADQDERSRLGVVLAVAEVAGEPRVGAAHYVRPVALDTHGHVQRLPPAVLATWNPVGGAWDHFAWGVVPDLAGRLGVPPLELEREQARRAAGLRELAAEG